MLFLSVLFFYKFRFCFSYQSVFLPVLDIPNFIKLFFLYVYLVTGLICFKPLKRPFMSLSCSEAKTKRCVHWSTFIFDHGHFPLRTIDIDNTTSKEAVSLIINILLPCERERGSGGGG